MCLRYLVGCCVGLTVGMFAWGATAAAQETLDLNVAVQRGLVAVDVQSLGGATGKRLKVNVQKTTDRKLNVTVAPGTVFQPEGADVQKIAAVQLMGKYIPGNQYRRGSVMVLVDNQPHDYLVQTVCIDYHKSSPRHRQRYKIKGVDVRCQRILSAPNESGSIWSYQSAVWMDRSGVKESDLQRKFHVKSVDIQVAKSMIDHAEKVGAEQLKQVDVSVDVRNQVQGLFSADPHVRVEAYRRVQGLSQEDQKKLKVLVDVNVIRGGELPDESELVAANTLDSLMPEGLDLPKLQIPNSLEELSIMIEGLPRSTGTDGETALFPRARLLSLMAGLRSRRPGIRILAARNVAKVKDPWAVDTLIVTLGDTNQRVRQAAARGLTDLTGQDFGEDQQKWRDWWEDAEETFGAAAEEPEQP